MALCHRHLNGQKIAPVLPHDSILEGFRAIVHSEHEAVLSSQGCRDPSWPILKRHFCCCGQKVHANFSSERAHADDTQYLFQTSAAYWPPYQYANEGWKIVDVDALLGKYLNYRRMKA